MCNGRHLARPRAMGRGLLGGTWGPLLRSDYCAIVGCPMLCLLVAGGHIMDTTPHVQLHYVCCWCPCSVEVSKIQLYLVHHLNYGYLRECYNTVTLCQVLDIRLQPL